MSENRKMSAAAKIIVVASLALVVLLFCGIGLRAFNNPDNESGTIGEARAEEIVLKDAGLSAEDVQRMSFRTDYDDGRMIYEVDFYTQDTEYEYDIDARSGEILKREKEPRRDWQNNQTAAPDKAVGITPAPQTQQPTTAPSSNTLISAEKAKETALSHAGVEAASVTHYKSERDRENGVEIYEITFKSGRYEFEYDINAKTGAVIKSDKDIDD